MTTHARTEVYLKRKKSPPHFSRRNYLAKQLPSFTPGFTFTKRNSSNVSKILHTEALRPSVGKRVAIIICLIGMSLLPVYRKWTINVLIEIGNKIEHFRAHNF